MAPVLDRQEQGDVYSILSRYLGNVLHFLRVNLETHTNNLIRMDI